MFLKLSVLALSVGVALAQQCGFPAITPKGALSFADFLSGNGRIVGGLEATPHSWPWQVALVDTTGWQFCGGSIINQNYVLTAAHCCAYNGGETPQPPSRINVRIGDHNKNVAEGLSETRTVRRVLIHPEYQFLGYAVYDFCLLELNAPLVYNNHVSPVCLADETDGPVGKKCIATGWGSTVQRDHNRPSAPAVPAVALQQAELTIVSQAACNKAYSQLLGEVVSADMICAHEDFKSVCQGDSGGPIVCQSAPGQPFKQVGVASWLGGCADTRKYPSVFARTSAAFPWISATAVPV